MAATVIYNDQGVPLMDYGKNLFASTTGIPEKTKYTEQIQDVDNTVSPGAPARRPRAPRPNFPQEASKVISRTGV